MKKNRKGVVCSLILALALMAGGCASQADSGAGQGTGSEAKDSGKDNTQITVYISGPEQMLIDLEEAFEKEQGDVLNILHMGCGPLAQKVHTEAEAGDVQADIIWGAEPMLYIELQKKGLLQQYHSPQASNLKSEFRFGDGYYTICSARYGVIAYNRDKVSQEEIPSSWQDLVKENWNNRLAMADAGQSATALAITAGLVAMNVDDWSYLEGLKKNGVLLTKQNNEAIERVASGEVDATIAPHDGILREIKKAKKAGTESKLALVWPEEGSLSLQRPIAIMSDEQRTDADEAVCQDFIDFVISQPAQTIMSKYGFIPVRSDVDIPEGVPASIKSIALDWEQTAADVIEMRSKFETIMLAK